MSLLDRGRETVILYPEVVVTDADGNIKTQPSATGITITRCVVQTQNQSGTAARRKEQDNEGFETDQIYRVRLPRSYQGTIGAQAKLVWRGQEWAVFGDPIRYSGSARTAHYDFSIRRY